ncbi:MAG TPA: alpha/beta hydrolase [Prosthecobacter sp.]|nr:alpha/beta hydrolase [Prosthecobacter sp.]
MPDHTLKLASGLTLGYAEHGASGGVPLLYFHGWPSARVQGALLDEVGKKLGLRIISPDRPGIGLSDYQPNRRLLDWPDTMRELADHIGAEKFHLTGWSGGGPYVLATAFRMPERLLSATVVCGAPPLSFFGHEKLFWPYRVMIRLRRLFPSVLHLLLYAGEHLTRGEIHRPPLSWMMGLLAEPDRRVLSQPRFFQIIRGGMVEALRRGPQMIVADADIYLSEWGFQVSDVQFPVHFWHGKEDRNIHWQYSEQMAALMPRATTHWLENDGHYSLAINHCEAITRHALGQ